MEEWQLNFLEKLSGAKLGEQTIFMSGRQAGKSVFTAQVLKRLMEDIANRPIEDILLGEARVSGARYYTVEPIGGNWMDMEVWCIKTFGPSAEVWNIGKDSEFIWPETGRWYKNNRRFWFRDEKDRTMFLLRWR